MPETKRKVKDAIDAGAARAKAVAERVAQQAGETVEKAGRKIKTAAR